MQLLRKILHRAILVIVISVCANFTFATATPTNSQPVNRIVAIVNDTIITQTQLNTMLKTAHHQKVTQQEAVQALINQELQLQIAKQAGISVSAHEVNQAMVKIAAQNHLTVAKLKSNVISMGLSVDNYKKQLHKQIMLSKVQQQAIGSKVNVTKQEVATFLQKHGDQLGLQARYQYSDLLFSTDNITTKKALQLAKKVRTSSKKNMTLAQIQQQLPSTTNAKILLNASWQTPDAIPSIFITALNRLQPGSISKPIITGNGVHLLQLQQRQLPPKNARQQRAYEILAQQAFMKAVKTWVNTLRKNAYIKIMNAS